MNATRLEQITLNLTLDYDEVQKHKDALMAIGAPKTLPVYPGDTYNVSYSFICEYFGDVEAKLTAALYLLENAKVFKADAKEWRYGESLIIKIAQLMDRISTKLSPKKPWWRFW